MKRSSVKELIERLKKLKIVKLSVQEITSFPGKFGFIQLRFRVFLFPNNKCARGRGRSEKQGGND